jgi:SAM-dependent methyltransferase
MDATTPPVCDYEGSDYRTRFWEGQGRSYEDRVERVALRRLLPPTGATLIEIGAGFGRLADEYRGYDKVVLFDYSRSLLREAQAHLGDDPRFIYVAGNWYNLPFVDGLFEALVQVRTLHHAADAPALFRELHRVAAPRASYVLEFANKRNLKAILRYWLRRQAWSPFAPEPVEFVELNFDFHPRWIRRELQAAGFEPGRTLTVSHFRLAPLKKLLPTDLLVALDSLAQLSGPLWQLTPSVFVRNRRAGPGATAEPGTFFACPTCQTPLGADLNDGILSCPGCGLRWTVSNGLYDFKDPIQ